MAAAALLAQAVPGGEGEVAHAHRGAAAGEHAPREVDAGDDGWLRSTPGRPLTARASL